MAKPNNLTGQKFGKLTVVKRGEDYISPSGAKRIQWLCKCDCGNEDLILVAANNLTSGHTKSCGCLSDVSPRFKDITGETFGRWHVLKRGENDKYGKARWWCWCDCQKELPIEDRELHLLSTNILISKKSTSCGCYQKELLSILKANNKYSLKDHGEDNEDFWAYKIGENVVTNTGSIKIVKRYYENGDKIKSYSGKYYYYICNICGYECDDQHIILENNLKNGSGCARCSGRDGDIFATKRISEYASWMTCYLKNKDDANVYGIGSRHLVDVVCPECGHEDKKRIISMYRSGFHCDKCGDGISYPEKFVREVLNQLDITFIHQLSKCNFDWIGKYRYDFYLPDFNMIIEAHGGQHYYEGFTSGRTLKEEQENDNMKKILAMNNGIAEYVVINCRESNKQWISNSINKELSKYFDLSKVDYDKCEANALKSMVKKVCSYYKDNENPKMSHMIEVFGLDRTTIIKYLKQGAALKWCNYVPRPKHRKIRVCKDGIFIGEFEKIKDFIQYAKEHFNINILSQSVTAVCQGRYSNTKGFVCEYID